MSPQAGLRAHYEARAEAYASFGTGLVARRALELLPPGGAVLDLGCASGGLLALLAPRAGHLAGLELSTAAAARAAAVGDHVVRGALEDPGLPFATAGFDLVVLADVLEHLVDPGAGLRRAVGWCRPGGAVLVSVPNIAHWRARLTLLRGRWPSEETGTFDSGHLRFFTGASLGTALHGAGLRDPVVEPVVPALDNDLPVRRLPPRVRFGLERRWQDVARRRPGLLGYQLVASGRRPG